MGYLFEESYGVDVVAELLSQWLNENVFVSDFFSSKFFIIVNFG